MKHALMIGQLENVSGQVLEEYSSAIKEMVAGKSGIALFKNIQAAGQQGQRQVFRIRKFTSEPQ